MKVEKNAFFPILISALIFFWVGVVQAQSSFEQLQKDFTQEVGPLLKQNCLVCHSTEKQEGDLDLERFRNLSDVRREADLWRNVLEQIASGEMPPKNRKPLGTDEKLLIKDWIQNFLKAEALAHAGDPGPVLVRRLTNVEFDNTIRDLTGIDLKPTREFPADGAAGEGFSNVGDALVMSPSLFEKYLEAAKQVASHLVLTPSGVRFSPTNTQSDWTNEILAEIREFYRKRTDPEGHTRVSLQGLQWDTNAGGRIPLSPYLAATMKLRESKNVDDQQIQALAKRESLSPKYLKTLWLKLNSEDLSPLLKIVQKQWQNTNRDSVQTLALEIQNWQKALTEFGSVGHFKQWLLINNPIVDSLNINEKINVADNQSEVELHLGSNLVSGSSENARLLWKNIRLEQMGRPSIPLTLISEANRELERLRHELQRTSVYLKVLEESKTSGKSLSESAALLNPSLDSDLIQAWARLTGWNVDSESDVRYMKDKVSDINGYSFVNGWGSPATPNAIANASDQTVRVPGILKPHSVAVHPSPSDAVAIRWKSPGSYSLNIKAIVNDAHGDCGNGVTWSLELRRGGARKVLAAGFADTSKPNIIPEISSVRVTPGTLIVLVIGPRNNEHTCDLTEVDLELINENSEAVLKKWKLSSDLSPRIHSGNPSSDRYGHAGVWGLALESVRNDNGNGLTVIPPGSALDHWISAENSEQRLKLAEEIDKVFQNGGRQESDTPNDRMFQLIRALNGPLLGFVDFSRKIHDSSINSNKETKAGTFEKIRLPAEWCQGRTLQATVTAVGNWPLDQAVQIDSLLNPGQKVESPGSTKEILVGGAVGKAYWEKAFDDFRELFPGALCYPQIVPVDEVVTLALFHREDENLTRLMLSEVEKQALDQLWDELWYVSQEPLKVEVGYRQFMEYVTQDGDVRVFEPLRKPIRDRAEEFRKKRVLLEPDQRNAVIEIINQAWRRPLTEEERTSLFSLYEKLRTDGIPHDQSLRLLLVRALVSSSFLYRLEPTEVPTGITPLNQWELASRLSYFLWSSMPDKELRSLADHGRLTEPGVLSEQVRRMLSDGKSRSLATEFACQWLHLKDFYTLNEKSEKIFPEFLDLRSTMYEEVVRFFTDFFQQNRPVIQVFDSDRSFVNETLARFYEIDGVTGDQWRQVQGMRQAGRGGVLGFAALTARQSGASRTSPILRGNWVLETLLGEKLPKPPKNVPQLPESELDTDGLTMRQITERHRSDPACSKCHDRIDPFGMALESFDAIGRLRQSDLAGRKIDTTVDLADGTQFEGLEGLRNYLLTNRRSTLVHQFHRKLLGYALGRNVMVSDDPLLEELDQNSMSPDSGVGDSIERIVKSPQFLNQRGNQFQSVSE